jgi:hypothetical protein
MEALSENFVFTLNKMARLPLRDGLFQAAIGITET